MSARTFLVLGAALLFLAWLASATGLTRQLPALLRLIVAGIFVLGAVRIGLSIAIIAFGLTPASYLIPISLGVLAWWLRPGRDLRA